MAQNDKNRKKMHFILSIRVRDSELAKRDPLGTRPAQRGLVLGGERQALAQTIAPRKDQGLIAMSYKNVYVGRIALGANDAQALKVLQEAEALYTTAQVKCKRECPTDLCSRLRRQLDSCRLQLTVVRP